MDRVEKINGLPLWDTMLRTDINNFEPMINDKADKNHKHDEYLTKVEAADKYATLIYLTTEISKIIGLIDNIDLSHLVEKSELENKKYLTSVPDEYITESELNDMGFLKNQQDVSEYTTTTYLNSEINTLENWVNDNYAKKIELDALRARLQQLEDEINKLKKDMDDMEADVDELEVVVGFSVIYNLTDVTSSNIINYVEQDTSYNTKLSCVSNYNFTSVKVTMGGTDITNSVVTTSATDERTINISKVTGNIVITAVAKEVVEKVYTITYKLTNVSSTNKTSNITGENNSYSTTLNPSEIDYEIDSVTVTMGGTNITSSVVSGDSSRKIVDISKVTGNIVITATAKYVSPPYFYCNGHMSGNTFNCTCTTNYNVGDGEVHVNVNVQGDGGVVVETYAVTMRYDGANSMGERTFSGSTTLNLNSETSYKINYLGTCNGGGQSGGTIYV